ncbi:MAG TPA: DUF1990 family protein [Chloroflexaceae bacterium]|nr:DUF1990 family protein [Chloroflexaceae bacterium]
MFAALKRLLTGRAEPSPNHARRRPSLGRLAFWRRAPRPVPARLLRAGRPVQLPGDGHGPLFHRRYAVDFAGSRLGPEALMAQVKADLSDFSPRMLAHFEKTKGDPAELREGDEYHITILGPWNGRVRVVEAQPTSFTFITLEGHPEAGQIMFSLEHHPARRGALRFEICSWARSRDMIVGLTYKEVGVGKEVQKNAWVTFCERVVEASGGKALGEVSVVTEEQRFDGEVIPIE